MNTPRRRAVTGVGMVLALAIAACSRHGARAPELAIECRVEPDPPVVGAASVELRVADSARVALSGARVAIVANMTHAGMVPHTARAHEIGPGRYRAALDLDMAGDWYLDVEVRTADGYRAERTFDLKGVRAR